MTRYRHFGLAWSFDIMEILGLPVDEIEEPEIEHPQAAGSAGDTGEAEHGADVNHEGGFEWDEDENGEDEESVGFDTESVESEYSIEHYHQDFQPTINEHFPHKIDSDCVVCRGDVSVARVDAFQPTVKRRKASNLFEDVYNASRRKIRFAD